MNDAISRQAAVDAIRDEAIEAFSLSDEYEYFLRGLKAADSAIRRIQTEESDRKKGKWIRPNRPKTYERFCSECQRKAWYCGIGDYNYCPNCGAELEASE